MDLIFICKRISLDDPPLHFFNCKSTQLLISIEISLFKQKDQVDHAESGHFSWTWKNDVSLLYFVRLRFFFFSNFLFALLDQLKGLMFYFPCFLLCKFGYLVRASLLYSWWVLIFVFCGILVRLLIFRFVCLFIFLSAGNMRHLIVGALIAKNLMNFFFLGVNSNGHIGILLAMSRMNMIPY